MNDHINTLSTVASQVLETTAFALVDPYDSETPSGVEESLASRINFVGQVCGELTIAAPRELCVALTANILSLEAEDVDDSMAADTLNEMANVICGHWITSVCGVKPIVQLDVPRSMQMGGDKWTFHAKSPSSTMLMVEDLPFLLDLQLSKA